MFLSLLVLSWTGEMSSVVEKLLFQSRVGIEPSNVGIQRCVHAKTCLDFKTGKYARKHFTSTNNGNGGVTTPKYYFCITQRGFKMFSCQDIDLFTSNLLNFKSDKLEKKNKSKLSTRGIE